MLRNKLTKIMTRIMALKLSGVITEEQFNGIVYPLKEKENADDERQERTIRPEQECPVQRNGEQAANKSTRRPKQPRSKGKGRKSTKRTIKYSARKE